MTPISIASEELPGSASAATARPFSTRTMPSTWNNVARRVAAVTSPNATSVSAERSAAAELQSEIRYQPDQCQGEPDGGPTPGERLYPGANGTGLTRAVHEQPEEDGERDTAYAERHGSDRVVRR